MPGKTLGTHRHVREAGCAEGHGTSEMPWVAGIMQDHVQYVVHRGMGAAPWGGPVEVIPSRQDPLEGLHLWD